MKHSMQVNVLMKFLHLQRIVHWQKKFWRKWMIVLIATMSSYIKFIKISDFFSFFYHKYTVQCYCYMTRCEQRVAKFHHSFESELNWCTQKNEEEKSESQKNCRKDSVWREKKIIGILANFTVSLRVTQLLNCKSHRMGENICWLHIW